MFNLHTNLKELSLTSVNRTPLIVINFMQHADKTLPRNYKLELRSEDKEVLLLRNYAPLDRFTFTHIQTDIVQCLEYLQELVTVDTGA